MAAGNPQARAEGHQRGRHQNPVLEACGCTLPLTQSPGDRWVKCWASACLCWNRSSQSCSAWLREQTPCGATPPRPRPRPPSLFQDFRLLPALTSVHVCIKSYRKRFFSNINFSCQWLSVREEVDQNSLRYFFPTTLQATSSGSWKGLPRGKCQNPLGEVQTELQPV